MKIIYYFALICFITYYNSIVSAQCPVGEVEVTIQIETDNYGYEGYWQLVPAGNSCGSGIIASGGNTLVGCNGGGDQDQDPGGYGNNQTINVGPWCLTENASFTIHYIDDWGDGGFHFTVMVNGYVINEFTGSGSNHIFTFTATEPPAYDAAVISLLTANYNPPGDISINGILFNYGTATLNSLDLNYQINSDPVITQNITGINILNNSEYHFYHSVMWIPSVFGVYTVKVWVNNLNGNADLNPTNDTALKTIEIGPGIANIIDQYVSTTTLVTTIGSTADGINTPTDLDFHPTLTKKELWVINKETESTGGSTVKFSNAGEFNQTSLWQQDDNAWHFMSLPTGIAFSENENFATSPGVYDANHDGGAPFTGPALWSSDPDIYSQNWGGLGSHIDMLHESPYSQGIAADHENVFWVFDGNSGDIVRYDFQDDHGPGNDDHSDGIIWRYSEENVAKDPANIVVSHLVLDKQTGWLYVVDNGNQRVIRINTNTGSFGGSPSYDPYETLEQYVEITGYTWETVVDSGLQDPAGIDVIDNRMVVSDYSTGNILIYDISILPAVLLGQISTGNAGVQGIKIGYDGKIWFINSLTDIAARLDFEPVGIAGSSENHFQIFPNPSSGKVRISGINSGEYDLIIRNNLGQVVFKQNSLNNQAALELNLSSGIYHANFYSKSEGKYSTENIIIQQY
jgi:hypothetical protein